MKLVALSLAIASMLAADAPAPGPDQADAYVLMHAETLNDIAMVLRMQAHTIEELKARLNTCASERSI